jgi:hypothetical protein
MTHASPVAEVFLIGFLPLPRKRLRADTVSYCVTNWFFLWFGRSTSSDVVDLNIEQAMRG